MLKRHWYMGSACAALAAALTAVPAAAQSAPAETAETASDGALQEIVVTATRRDSNLQSTAIAISAVDESLIRQASPRNVGDLAAFVPNFSAATITNFNAASFSIRGVGQNSIIVYFEPPVAVLVDDFVMPSVQTQLLDTFDVSQVEVLRGPQGTLFGKNTTGGAVVVKTKRPQLEKIEVEGRLQVGDFGTVIPQAAFNLPIGQTLAFRGVIGHTQSDGYYKNGGCFGPVTPFAATAFAAKFAGQSGCGDGRSLGGQDVWNARAKLLWEPSDAFSALLQYEYLRDRSDSVPSVNLTPASNGFLFHSLGLGSVPNRNSDPLKNAALTDRQGALIKEKSGQIVNVDGAYLNMDYKTDWGTFTSVSGYRNQRSRLPNTYMGTAPVASDGTVLSLFDAQRDDNRKTYQQELRFASSFDGPFNFVAGGFYQKDKTSFCVAQLLGFLDLASGGPGFGNWNDNPYLLCNAQRSRSKATFVEGTFKFTPTLTLTGGFRYTWENKSWYGRQQVFAQQLNGGFDPSIVLEHALDANVFDYTAGVIKVKDSAREPTWRVSLGWQATPTVFAYATYSRGFKAGGFNDQIGSFHPFVNADGSDNPAAFAAAASATKPERADSYEAGVKTELFDRHLRFNLTGFYVDYNDLQKQIVVPLVVGGQQFQVTRFFNAAKATVKGIELESTLIPVQGLTLRGLVGYQDGKYKSYVTPIPAGYDLSSAPLDRLPKWQWTADATYELPIGDFKLQFNGNINYVARNLFTQSITSPAENTFLNARTLYNASITLMQADDKYYVRLIGRNLSDKRYLTGSQVVGGLWANGQYGPPRYFGAEVGFKLGN
ncbi:TonB-dependent receptor [Sphingomonas histidinilytica]|uniref:Iron complex outermembrane recepter protein n=1 Tax=Rhizorhabdus histidinilytica TaxID=439228 RepID=A0A1T5FWZ6_9SPHN|nr:TonB-dependent receptor [Rhizorhabdus histidinilytica]MBO9375860.1 TonB-dependent receptor [Rhizorhabdus histidinilytica]SKC00681.1 iron complex outermembrane recepter protein [Rhizorhabdus histidinilytica]